MSSENHYVTPTYQSVLIFGLDLVARRLADDDTMGSWKALETLYVELPPDCQKDCQDDFNSVKDKIAKIIESIHGINLYRTHARRAYTIRKYLVGANLQLFNSFKNSLFKKGYLENSPTKPRNPQPTTLGESE